MTFERVESSIPVIAYDFCFLKTSGIVPGVTADEGETCLVLLDVDTGYMKAVPAAVNTVTEQIPSSKEGNASLSSSFDADVVYVAMENPRLWLTVQGWRNSSLSQHC